jgi:carboxypeptidase family protein
MKIRVFAIAGAFALACATAPSSNSAVVSKSVKVAVSKSVALAIPQFDVDSVTHDSAGNRAYALVGVVLDAQSGEPLHGGVVILRPPSGRGNAVGMNQQGGFVMGRVSPGRYTLVVRQIGFKPFSESWNARAGIVDTIGVSLVHDSLRLQD